VTYLKQSSYFIIAAFLLTLALGCSSGDAEAQLRERATALVGALYDGNREQLEELAPGLLGEGAGQRSAERLFKTIRSYPDWRIETIKENNGRARVTIRFSGEAQDLVLRVPFRQSDERWIAESDIRFSTTLDFVPLE
jgi:hypothetical protein